VRRRVRGQSPENPQGVGALKVGASAAFDYKDAVLVPDRYVKMPAGVKSLPAKAEDSSYASNVWIELGAFLESVQQLK
jgi:hypothetical protein